MSLPGVMQVVDTLDAGGAERVAVNLANLLPRDRFRPFLCTTRRDGLLASQVAPGVERLCLKRRGRFDLAALRRLVAFARERDVRLLHAHGPSLFLAVAASLRLPGGAVIWHDHYGAYAVKERPAWLYGPPARRTNGVIAVNEPLRQWAAERLRVPGDRVWYLPNFVIEPPPGEPAAELPGAPGARIVCVANLRAQKDHPNLLRALARVVAEFPEARLLLVGTGSNPDYTRQLEAEIESLGLRERVSLLGQRGDVAAVLRGSDIGVLSSASEGLPLALIEYGMAGLAAVATRVGQCAEVLDEGRAGVLVPPRDPEALAEALLALLRSPEERARLAARLGERARTVYAAGPVLERLRAIYETALAGGPSGGKRE